jgi:hypothetical protein
MKARHIRRAVFRRCVDCYWEWTNFEVPMTPKWIGKRVDYCPACKEKAGKGKTMRALTPTFLATKGFVSMGEQWALSLGAIYRRRECRVKTCVTPPEYGGKTGKRAGQRTRWTTIEVAADGIVMEDPAVCDRCNGRGRIIKGPDLE